jgi:hypothetical protein
LEEEFCGKDAMMIDLDRAVMLVRPKQPYLDWACSIDDHPVSITLQELRSECTAYLTPVVEFRGDRKAILERYYTEVFENELLAWHQDPDAWPPIRTLEVFREWFDVKFHEMVCDLVEDESIGIDDISLN